MKPLTQFICDTCTQVIERPADGMLEWENIAGDDGKTRHANFRIVHHLPASPLASQNPKGCYCHNAFSDHLDNLQGEGAQAFLLSQLNMHEVFQRYYTGPRVSNVREIVEVYCRLNVPHYEEARQYFQTANADGYFIGFGNDTIYTSDFLKKLVDTYRKQ